MLAHVQIRVRALGANHYLICSLRRDPFHHRWSLRTVHQLKLSVGAIVGAVHEAARRANRQLAAVVERIRGAAPDNSHRAPSGLSASQPFSVAPLATESVGRPLPLPPASSPMNAHLGLAAV